MWKKSFRCLAKTWQIFLPVFFLYGFSNAQAESKNIEVCTRGNIGAFQSGQKIWNGLGYGICFLHKDYLILVYPKHDEYLYSIKIISRDDKIKWIKSYNGDFKSIYFLQQNVLLIEEQTEIAYSGVNTIDVKTGKKILGISPSEMKKVHNKYILIEDKMVLNSLSERKKYYVINAKKATFKILDYTFYARPSCVELDSYDYSEKITNQEIIFIRKDDCGEFKKIEKWN